MNLTEFLLARITEDEVEAHRRIQFGEGVVGPWVHPTPTRVMHECEAKRQIVRGHRLGHCECRAVRHLALPYADHPDYREEWKPWNLRKRTGEG